MVSVETKGNAQLVVQSAFGADLQHMWVSAWHKAPTSTMGHEEGSKLFCALHNLLVAFTMIPEKQRLVDAKADFQYLGGGFEVTWMALEHFFCTV